MKQFLLLVFTSIMISSCATLKEPDFKKIQIGMSKEQVIKRLGNKYNIISAKKYDDGVLEIFEFLKVPGITSTYSDTDYNWLFFFNNELVEWGPKTNYLPYNPHRDYRRKRNNY